MTRGGLVKGVMCLSQLSSQPSQATGWGPFPLSQVGRPPGLGSPCGWESQPSPGRCPMQGHSPEEAGTPPLGRVLTPPANIPEQLLHLGDSVGRSETGTIAGEANLQT